MDKTIEANILGRTPDQRRNIIVGIAIVSLLVISTYQIYTLGVIKGDFEQVFRLTQEDGVFESIDALGFWVSSVLFGWAAVKARQRGEPRLIQLFLMGLAALFFFGAGEEISWGQRIFDFSTPDVLVDYNYQGEFNVHNLQILGIKITNVTRRAYTLFWFVLTILIPGTSYLSKRIRQVLSEVAVVYPWWVGVPFVVSYICLRVMDYLSPETSPKYILGQIQETNLAILFVALAVYTVWAFNRGEDSAEITEP